MGLAVYYARRAVRRITPCGKLTIRRRTTVRRHWNWMADADGWSAKTPRRRRHRRGDGARALSRPSAENICLCAPCCRTANRHLVRIVLREKTPRRRLRLSSAQATAVNSPAAAKGPREGDWTYIFEFSFR